MHEDERIVQGPAYAALPNILSEPTKPTPEPRVMVWLREHELNRAGSSKVMRMDVWDRSM